MKKRLVIFVLLALPFLACAEVDMSVQGDRVEQRVERLTKKLALTDEQKAKVKTIFETQREKMKAVHEETHTSLQAVLTPEQMKTFDEMHQQWREQKQQRRQQKK